MIKMIMVVRKVTFLSSLYVSLLAGKRADEEIRALLEKETGKRGISV